MNTLSSYLKWLDDHKDWGLDLIRIYLGVALLIRGILFLMNMESLAAMVMETRRFQSVMTIIVHYVGLAHITGGLLMAFGIGTRVAAAIQVPVLFGAVFFVHLKEGLLAQGQSLELASLVLFLLLIYTWCGSGRLSVDAYLAQKQESK